MLRDTVPFLVVLYSSRFTLLLFARSLSGFPGIKYICPAAHVDFVTDRSKAVILMLFILYGTVAPWYGVLSCLYLLWYIVVLLV